MAFLSVIRRWALRDKISIREIARRTGLSRNTIRKYLRAGDVTPQFSIPDHHGVRRREQHGTENIRPQSLVGLRVNINLAANETTARA